MNIEQITKPFFRLFRSRENAHTGIENIYIEPEQKKPRISHTVHPDQRLSLTDTFKTIHNESNKLKFNRWQQSK